MRKAVFIALLLCTTAATAQVYRCKDTAGRTTYSDHACGVGQSETVMRPPPPVSAPPPRPAPAPIRATVVPQQGSAPNVVYQQAPVVRRSGNDWTANNELRNARVSANSIQHDGGRFDAAAEAQRARERQEAKDEAARLRAATSAPSPLTRCTRGFCYDASGGVYNRVGNTLTRSSDGRFCSVVGQNVQCP